MIGTVIVLGAAVLAYARSKSNPNGGAISGTQVLPLTGARNDLVPENNHAPWADTAGGTAVITNPPGNAGQVSAGSISGSSQDITSGGSGNTPYSGGSGITGQRPGGPPPGFLGL